MQHPPTHRFGRTIGSAAALALALVPLVAGRSAHAQGWVPGPAVPTAGNAARSDGVALWANGSLMVFGGLPLDAAGDAPVDQLLASWVARIPLEGRFDGIGAAVDGLGRTIVFGGEDPANGDPGENYVWTIADGKDGDIAQRSSQAPKQRFAVATDAQGLVYSIGGSNGPALVAASSGLVERYDASADAWTALAPLPTPVTDAAACMDPQGHVLVFGGFDTAGARSANVARYDPALDAWSDTAVPDLPVALAGAESVLGADGRIYVIGGDDGAPRSDVLVFDPVTASWSNGPAMAQTRVHFGATIDPLGNLWVVGGEGTNTVETLFTPTCPSVTRQPAAAQAWLGAGAGFELEVSGTGPFTYQWRRDGVALGDGPTAWGSTISGASTAQLGVLGVKAQDAGTYDCVIANACGLAMSAGAALTTRTPPALPGAFTARSLHPAGALQSKALGVDGTTVVGEATYPHPQYNSLSHPMRWSVASGAGVDMTPAGSVGGGARAIRGDAIVGWWWWPYTTRYGTGYYAQACIWTNGGTVHHQAQTSGWDIGYIYATDGTTHAGAMRPSETSIDGHGAVWTGVNRSPRTLTPPSMRSSVAAAVDDGTPFGQVHIGYGVVHAAKWVGSNREFVDLNPPGASRSSISAAGDGVQLGSATLPGLGAVDGIWSGSAGSFRPFQPVGLTGMSAAATRMGLVAGSATIGGRTHAVLVSIDGQQLVDLHAFAPAGFDVTVATDLSLDPQSGALTVSGYGHDPIQNNYQACVWTSAATQAAVSFYGRPCPTQIGFAPDGQGGWVATREPAVWVDDGQGSEIAATIAAEGVSAPIALPFAFAMPGGAAAPSIVVGDNGRVFAAGVGGDAVPSVGALLQGPASIAPLWADLDAAAGSVRVAHDPGGQFSTITWRDVPQAGESNGLTFRVTLHADGRFALTYLATTGWIADPLTGASDVAIAGCSQGGGAADPGSRSFTVPALQSSGDATLYQSWDGIGQTPDLQPRMVADSLPVVGGSFDFGAAGVSGGAFFAFAQIGFSNPDQDLAPLGLPGCRLYASPDEPLRPLAIVAGARATTSLAIPNLPSFVGMEAFVQAALLVPGEGPLGILTTDGMRIVLGR